MGSMDEYAYDQTYSTCISQTLNKMKCYEFGCIHC